MSVQQVYLIRHGETPWSLSGQHTGLTDIPLTDHGREVAGRIAPLLADVQFKAILSSPLVRAQETCKLTGLGERAAIDPDLVEWNYGEYEGLTPKQIHGKARHWLLFRDGCPGGEDPQQVGARVDRLIAKVRAIDGNAALFGHGHLFRVFAARWLGLPVAGGSYFLLDPSTLSVLSYYRGIPAVKCWNAKPVKSSLAS